MCMILKTQMKQDRKTILHSQCSFCNQCNQRTSYQKHLHLMKSKTIKSEKLANQTTRQRKIKTNNTSQIIIKPQTGQLISNKNRHRILKDMHNFQHKQLHSIKDKFSMLCLRVKRACISKLQSHRHKQVQCDPIVPKITCHPIKLPN